MYNSQSSEIESIVDRFFPKPGYFLEIGCWDGELISQTAYLEREKGWKGLCVDPSPCNFKNRTCKVCTQAISGNGKSREFVQVSIDRRDGGNVSYFSGFKDSISHWPLISKWCEYELRTIETITVDELYRQYNVPCYVEFLSLDTEGSETEIVSSIDFDRFRYGVVMFEHNRDNDIRRTISRVLIRNGYRFFKGLAIDDVYVWGELI